MHLMHGSNVSDTVSLPSVEAGDSMRAIGRLSFEGAQVAGREAIVQKLTVGIGTACSIPEYFRQYFLLLGLSRICSNVPV